jgi:NADH-quinone oxidoreductase subunit C
MTVEAEAVLAKIRESLPDAGISILKNPGPSGQNSLLVNGADLVAVFEAVKSQGFELLSNVSGVDWPDPAKADAVAIPEGEIEPAGEGFLEVVYHLYSISRREGPLVLRARTRDRGANADVPSVVSVYRSAEFQEREIFDLYGVVFTGHPDLRRILMWDEFEDHPMRKDYVAPDDYEYEPTPHDSVLEKAQKHYPADNS